MLNHDDFVIAALVEEGILDRATVDAAVKSGAERQLSPCAALVEQGKVTARELAIVRATICECPYVDLDTFRINIRNTALLPRTTAESLSAFPLFVLGSSATVAMADPLDLRAVDQLRIVLKCEIEPVLCEPASLTSLIERAYALSGDHPDGDGGLVEEAHAADTTVLTGKEPVVAAVNQIIAQAIERGASDIHIGPDERELHIRYRIDGVLAVQQGPGLSLHAGLVQRLKVMAHLDLTQTRRPQDGKFRFEHMGRAVDVRLSVIPTVCGENVVMRLLASAAAIKGFPELGLGPSDVSTLEQMIESPHGMLLVTGPTGSGKTTTLYTALKRINSPELNIVTIEDPVEMRLPMIRQVQTNAEIGMTFAGALRSILRQDPDVVFVGEIRDEETARIALQAALTGHLVLSSLHTNDAPGAIPRLRDFGCPAFAINASIVGIIAQRLVKRVCTDCAAPRLPDPALLARFGLKGSEAETRFVSGRGCSRCTNTGYRGRLGVYEIMRMSTTLQRCVEEGMVGEPLRRQAIAGGMRPMWEDGLAKARTGLTTLDEVARVAAVGEVAVHEDTLAKVGDNAMRLSA